jgi:flagellar biosynthetic protein FliR
MDMDLNVIAEQARIYLLVFVRITSLVIAAPVFGSAVLGVPVQAIVGLGAGFTLVVMMNLGGSVPMPPVGWQYGLMLAGEVFIGISLGFLASLVLAGIQFGGEVIDHLIGFAVVDVIDPVTNESASLIGNLKGLMATLLFLVFNGHHLLFQGLMRTFEAVPPGGAGLPTEVWPLMESYAEMMFVVGIQVAAPCLIVMTLLYVPEGFLARMVPQLNLMINDVPMRIGVGLFVVWLGIGPFVHLSEELINHIAMAADSLTLAILAS